MADEKARKGELLLDGIARLCHTVLRETIEIDPETAAAVADELVARVSETFGKDAYYIQAGRQRQAESLARRVFAAHRDNMPIPEIRRRFGISLQWTYTLLRRMRREYISRVQPDIFGEDAP